VKPSPLTAPPMWPIEARKQANPWAAYEAAKRELPANLTPAEYAAACTALAKRFGL
jgi:hypothetical protein